jgi:hypothetical protein
MSRISSIDSVNTTLAPSEQITEIIREFKVPEVDEGRYKVYICTPSRTQSFLTSPGDTIRKAAQGWIQEPRGTRYITLYPDDFIHSEYIGDDHEVVIGQLLFTSDMPGFDIDAPRPMSVKLRSVSNGDRSLAELKTGEVLSVRRVPMWNLERELGDGGGTYVIGTLRIDDQAGYAKCSEDTVCGIASGVRSSASDV